MAIAAPPPAEPSDFDGDLTSSVRRLVINLKDESERHQSEHHRPHQHDHSVLPNFVRRRGNSCPMPPAAITRTTGTYNNNNNNNSSTSSTSMAVDEAARATASESSKPRKKSALARLAPRLLDGLGFRRRRKTYLYTDEELESIEGARWKIVELAFRFGGKHRFYLVQAVNMFFPLTKYGRRGGPHATRLHCNRCGTLQWQHKRGGLSSPVDLADVLQVLEGRQTTVFRKYTPASGHHTSHTSGTTGSSRPDAACSFSIVVKDRTLDLETQSENHRDWLMSALRTLISYARKQRQAEQRAIAERSLLQLDDSALKADASAAPAAPLVNMVMSPRVGVTRNSPPTVTA